MVFRKWIFGSFMFGSAYLNTKKCIFHVCVFAFCCSRLFEIFSTYRAGYVVLIFAALADLAMLTNLLTLHHNLSFFAMEPADRTRQ